MINLDEEKKHSDHFFFMHNKVAEKVTKLKCKKFGHYFIIVQYLAEYISTVLHAVATDRYVEYALDVNTFTDVCVRIPYNLHGYTVEVIFHNYKTGRDSKKKRMNVHKLVRLLEKLS